MREGILIWETYRRFRYRIFQKRYELSILGKILLALSMAWVTGLSAQIRVSLPWTPVPITGQTFAVLLSGILLGRFWGGFSQILYCLLGVTGIRWFAGFSGGWSVLMGPTGGYIWGFILASFFLGYFTERFVRLRNFFPLLGLMFFANFFLIHIPGLLQLGLWYSVIKGTPLPLNQLFLKGTLPFIPGDVLKILLATGISSLLLPRESFHGEIDRGKG